MAGMALALLLAISLAGCVHEDRAINLNGDGSGSYTFTVGLSEEVVSLAGDSIKSQMDQYGQQITSKGGTYRHYDDTGYSYWAFTRHFSSVAGLNTLLSDKSYMNALSSGSSTSDSASTDTDHFTVSQSAGFLTNTFHITGSISMQPTTPPSSVPGFDPATVLKDAHDSIAITMPGWISSHTGGSVQGNSITYTVHYGETASIDVTGGGVNTAVVYPLAGGIVVVLLIAVTLVVVFALRRRRPTSPALVPDGTLSDTALGITAGTGYVGPPPSEISPTEE